MTEAGEVKAKLDQGENNHPGSSVTRREMAMPDQGRVEASTDDALDRLDSGDVLIAPFTGPSYNSILPILIHIKDLAHARKQLDEQLIDIESPKRAVRQRANFR
jgi:hypothetical protein